MTIQMTCCAQTTCACNELADEGFVKVSTINTLAFNAARCIGCALCLDVCPHGVFAPEDDRVLIARADACMECGACQRNCPVDALRVDSGVGCAAAMINAALRGLPEPSCGGPDGCCE